VLAAGTMLGPYKILAPLGAGGMGEVYRAHDTRLGRDVAIKVLSSHLAATPEIRARFEREARTISQLNHPHICTLYDIGHEGDTDYLVMELLEGETLAHRLEKGPLPLAEVLALGVQVADALDVAHRRGIVHRDLKPANVMLTKSGAKLMDFGLARAASAPDGRGLTVVPGGLSESPTVSRPLTREGAIVGTFQYMAPEQLEGHEADARSDIWALGCVLYEMATGKRAFEGTSQASLISAIMKDEPRPILELQPLTPPALERIVTACLEKDPSGRFQSAHDLGFALEGLTGSGIGTSPGGVPAAGLQRMTRREAIAWLLVLLAVTTGGVFGLRSTARRTSHEGILQTTLSDAKRTTVAGDGDWLGIALSPDGRRLVFVGIADGAPALFLRNMESLEAELLPGTERASYPFWSPDGSEVAFFADRQLKVLNLLGGATRVLCRTNRWGAEGCWSVDGFLCFTPGTGAPLQRIEAHGGRPEPVGGLDAARGELAQSSPTLTPDGRHILYTSWTASPLPEIRVLTLPTGRSEPLLPGVLRAAMVADVVVFVDGNTLYAQSCDLKAMRMRGERLPLAHGLTTSLESTALFSVSRDGQLVYLLPSRSPSSTLVWFDPAGHRLGTLGSSPLFLHLAISPDGKRVVADVQLTDKAEIRLIDTASGAESRLAFEAKYPTDAVWDPGGERIAFVDNVGPWRVFEFVLMGQDQPRLLAEGKEPLLTRHWSPDGRTLLLDRTRHPSSGADILQLNIGELEPLKPYAATGASECSPRFSPDGRWVAYTSDESGRDEIYVAGFPVPGTPRQISRSGGACPRWRGDGLELYYIEGAGQFMRVPISPGSRGLDFGAPVAMFRTRVLGVFGLAYDVAPDGRFLVSTVNDEGTSIVLVQNWLAELKR
jgi:Tol biopolymer transport system component